MNELEGAFSSIRLAFANLEKRLEEVVTRANLIATEKTRLDSENIVLKQQLKDNQLQNKKIIDAIDKLKGGN